MPIPEIDLTIGSEEWKFAYTKSFKAPDGIIYRVPTYRLTVSQGTLTSSPFEVLRFGVKKETPRSAAHMVGIKERKRQRIQGWNPDYPVHSAASAERGGWIVETPYYLIHDGPDHPDSVADPKDIFATLGCIEICGEDGFRKFNDCLLQFAGLSYTDGKIRGRQLTKLATSGKLWVTYQKAEMPAKTKTRYRYTW